MKKEQTINPYAYTVMVSQIIEADGSTYYNASVPAFAGNISICGDTPPQAIESAYSMIPPVAEYMASQGLPVPDPDRTPTEQFSGQMLIRTAPSIHAQL